MKQGRLKPGLAQISRDAQPRQWRATLKRLRKKQTAKCSSGRSWFSSGHELQARHIAMLLPEINPG